MSGFPSVNEQALHLVARELSATLNDVRIALEGAAETPADKTHVAKAAELMRAARGVLRVVEVYGAALLAEEMELTSRWLAGSETDARQFVDGLDALMRSSVQLPTYLERVLGGGRDLALVLLPLLNDLRAVRGAPLLSEGTLLSLNLSSEMTPSGPGTAAQDAKLTIMQWARRLRPRFQGGLLGLIRGEGTDRGLHVLSEVANRMESVATTTPVYQLWWVTGALLDALRADGLEASVTVKRLLGHVDRELKRLYTDGEQSYASAPPIELLNNLLFYVARSTASGVRIDAVKGSFRLGELLPVDESVEQERESLSAPSVRLMRTVAAAIKEDLGRVKDALDLYTRKGGPPEELAPQVDLLKKIGDTLAVLGLGSVREQVQGELARLADIIARRAPAEQETLIAIAATLIGVEDGLDDALVRLIMPPGAPAPGAETDPDFRQVTETVLRECIVNLARIKELLGQSLDPTSEPAGLEAAPALARGITAGLLLLGRNRAMEVMRRIADHVASVLGPGSLSRNDEYVDRLADAIVGIEYYMETLQAGRGDPWYMLDNAERCLVALDALRSAAVGSVPRAPESKPAAPPPRRAPCAARGARRDRAPGRRGPGAPHALHRGSARRNCDHRPPVPALGGESLGPRIAHARASRVPHAQGLRPRGRRTPHRRFRLGCREPAEPRHRRHARPLGPDAGDAQGSGGRPAGAGRRAGGAGRGSSRAWPDSPRASRRTRPARLHPPSRRGRADAGADARAQAAGRVRGDRAHRPRRPQAPGGGSAAARAACARARAG